MSYKYSSNNCEPHPVSSRRAENSPFFDLTVTVDAASQRFISNIG